MTAVKLARKKETVVTGNLQYDSKSKGWLGTHTKWCPDFHAASLEKHSESSLTPRSSIVQWEVRHCGGSLTSYTVLEDGPTPYRKLRGREYGGAIAKFGETVLFHLQGMGHMFPRR